MFSIKDYNKAIATMRLARIQIEPDGKNCVICGDNDHQAFECRHNPLVAMQLQDSFRCYHCGKWFVGEAAESHFGASGGDSAACQADNERLREFAREIIKDYCWNLGEPDGGAIQDLAEKLGLIEPHIATTEDVNVEFDHFGVGDTIYKFMAVLENEK